MELLSEILYKSGVDNVIGPTDIEISSIAFNSGKAKKGGLFVAVGGLKTDGHKFIDDAVKKGIKAVVCETMPKKLNAEVTYIKVKDSQVALGFIADNFYKHPSERIKIVGITGTNGKTTTATLLYQLFSELGCKCGLLSTVENKIGSTHIDAKYTTADAISINILLSQMVDEDCEYCFMEVSSHAIHQHRITGLNFTGGIFSNITHDHLDYHKTFKNYLQAKKMFFDDLPETAFALYNKDDKNGKIMVQNTKAKKYSYALRSIADFKTKIVENNFSGLQLEVNGNEVFTRLIGAFNAYNLLATYATASIFEYESIEILTALSKLPPVQGRFQHLHINQIAAIIDYAHTPDALKNVLQTISAIRTNNEKVIAIVGCGGNRDKEKRPLMAKIACKYGDTVILTSDNPRDEEPDTIIEDMKAGLDAVDLSKTIAVSNRKEAIRTACHLANPDDIILVAGKGHEKYQEIKGEKFPFDDVMIIKETLKSICE